MDALTVVGTVCGLVGWASLILSAFGRLALYRAAGVFAVGNGANALDAWLHGNLLVAGLEAGLSALGAWQWWNGGGGGGTRRRLRALRGVFRGVRRTAPVAGGAS